MAPCNPDGADETRTQNSAAWDVRTKERTVSHVEVSATSVSVMQY